MSKREVPENLDIIQRNGEAWKRQPDGSWLRFDMSSGIWLPSAVSPPPPPPPPPVAADPYFPLPKPSRGPLGLPDVRGALAGLDRRIAVVALVLVIGLFGIGGAALLGGDEPAPAAATLGTDTKLSKKAQLIHDADAICADLMTAMGKMDTPGDLGQLVQTLRVLRDQVWTAYKKLKNLEPPKKVRDEWKRYVGKPSGIEIFDDLVAAAERGDLARVASLAARLDRMTNKTTKDDRWAKRYGFKVCSQDSFEA